MFQNKPDKYKTMKKSYDLISEDHASLSKRNEDQERTIKGYIGVFADQQNVIEMKDVEIQRLKSQLADVNRRAKSSQEMAGGIVGIWNVKNQPNPQ